MHHADKIIARIIFLEGHPNLQSVAPLRIGQNVKEVLESDLAGEYDARTSYKKSREICHELGDYVTMELFEELLKDEEGHIDFLETQLDLLASIGDGEIRPAQRRAGQRGRIGCMRRNAARPDQSVICAPRRCGRSSCYPQAESLPRGSPAPPVAGARRLSRCGEVASAASRVGDRPRRRGCRANP